MLQTYPLFNSPGILTQEYLTKIGKAERAHSSHNAIWPH